MQDDSWLADDEGRLRPQVARLLSEVQPEPVPADPPAVERAFDFVDRHGQALLIGCGIVLAVLIALTIAACLDHPPKFESRVLTAITVHTDVGLNNETIMRLPAGEAVEVLEAKHNWCRILTRSGDTGWMFAGVIGRAKGPWLGPGYVVECMSYRSGGVTRTVPAGTFVLIEQKEDRHCVSLALADGAEIQAPADNILALENVR